jgi:hypothetical protein
MPVLTQIQCCQSNCSTSATIPRPGSGGRGGNIDLFAKDFKLPQVFKASIAVDQNC